MPPVLAPKGVVGEYGGGVLAPALLALAGSPFGPTPGSDDPDPEIGLTLRGLRSEKIPSRVLLTSLASGGAAAWLVLEKDR